jgi:hypothetical protein
MVLGEVESMIKRVEFEEWLREQRKFYAKMWLEYCRESGETISFYEFLLGLEFKGRGEFDER